jgi:hypothetical protein
MDVLFNDETFHPFCLYQHITAMSYRTQLLAAYMLLGAIIVPGEIIVNERNN